MHEKAGYMEHITKSWNEGGRTYKGYVAIVNVPGDDTYEVGLSPLRKALGWAKLTPEKVEILMACKPDTVSFCGKFIENGEERINTLQVTDCSAAGWARRAETLSKSHGSCCPGGGTTTSNRIAMNGSTLQVQRRRRNCQTYISG